MSLLPLGEITISSAAKKVLAEAGVKAESLLKRHRAGDWGDLSPESREWNSDAIEHDERVLSAYLISSDQKVWIITSVDRSDTSLMVPSESGRPLGKQITGKGSKLAAEIVEAACDGKRVEEIIEIAKSILDLAINHDGVDDYTRNQIIGKICWRYGLEPPADVQRALV